MSPREAAPLPTEAHGGPSRPPTLPNTCFLEEFTPGHVEIRSCPLPLGEEEEAVRASGVTGRGEGH